MQSFASSVTLRKELGNGLWVDIKEELSYGDKRALRKSLLATPADPEAANIRLIERAVTAWSLEGPISAETVDRLREEVVNRILLTLDAQYRPQDISNEEKKT